ncbi:NAD(P)/FAD-dependent oxidoreductase [Alphaproteobacteria bacterium]|nr:NAD(P)/FAD-dependent oxidoreductase [Alphaproteobacteria bacterium]
MHPEHQKCFNVATEWIASFNRQLTESFESSERSSALFFVKSFWRNALGLAWNLETITGHKNIVTVLRDTSIRAGMSDILLDCSASPPQWVNRADTYAIEAFIKFETKYTRGRGIIRLCPTESVAEGTSARQQWRAWTFFTAIDTLKGHGEKLDSNRPTGSSYSRDFRGPNWLDKRQLAQKYEDRDPTVLVVGGGQAGLSIAARLTQLGVDTLIVDRNERIGDNWRNRYHALTLHNQLQVNHLPYMPFPPTWPTYIPKDMLALWFETYAAAMELNFWTQCEVTKASYDDEAERWQVELNTADGGKRQMSPRHVIMATGVSGIPNLPKIDSLSAFQGPAFHSSQYHDGEDWSGKHAVVLGCGNSGHDIAQDLYSSGAKVTMIQRSPSLVVNIEPSAQFPYKLYDEERGTDECDFITTSMPTPLIKQAHRHFTKAARKTDKALLDGLENVGFKLNFGDDDTGWQFKYLTRGGGYYFNVGCSDLLADGKIDLVQFDQIDQFIDYGMVMKDGRKIDADIVILATGYKPQEYLVSKLFGDEIAARIGPIWGFGDGMELRNMYCQTGQPGLWFIAGSFAQCRIYSKYLALQIKALEEGIIQRQQP